MRYYVGFSQIGSHICCLLGSHLSALRFETLHLCNLVTIWVVIFIGLKFHVMWICYKLEIFVDINFCGCFILCVFLYLLKYVPTYMETTQFSSVIRGHHIYKEVWELIQGQDFTM